MTGNIRDESMLLCAFIFLYLCFFSLFLLWCMFVFVLSFVSAASYVKINYIIAVRQLTGTFDFCVAHCQSKFVLDLICRGMLSQYMSE